MKTFWSIIGVLVIATAAVWVVNGGAFKKNGTPTAAPTATTSAPPGSPKPESLPAPKAGDAVPAAPSDSSQSEPPQPSAAPGTIPQGHSPYHAAATGSVLASAGAAGTDPAKPADKLASNSNPLMQLPDLLKGTETPAAKPSSEAPQPAAQTPPAPAGSSATKPEDTGPKFTLGPATEVKQEEDGWTRLDGKYLVRGTGTASDPLIVPWELLVSASESYRPRSGLKEMPRRVADLKGKHVRVTGYALFPLMSLETTEVLLMRNQWDGCCIGVPPTPYDAVEVKLAKPADRKDSLVSFVTLEGVLDVDPYVNRDFLLGLFTMSEAALVQPAKGKDADKGL
jgi:hypothetical protein